MMSSCKKETPEPKAAITQTVDVSLKANESYTLELPKNLRDDEYQITSQAAHYSISSVGVNAAGNRIYQYTPGTAYTGTDEVIVSNDWEREQHAHQPPPSGSCSHPSGCDKQEEDHYIITIRFTITNPEVPANR